MYLCSNKKVKIFTITIKIFILIFEYKLRLNQNNSYYISENQGIEKFYFFLQIMQVKKNLKIYIVITMFILQIFTYLLFIYLF